METSSKWTQRVGAQWNGHLTRAIPGQQGSTMNALLRVLYLVKKYQRSKKEQTCPQAVNRTILIFRKENLSPRKVSAYCSYYTARYSCVYRCVVLVALYVWDLFFSTVLLSRPELPEDITSMPWSPQRTEPKLVILHTWPHDHQILMMFVCAFLN